MPDKPPPSLPPQRIRAPAVTLLDDEEILAATRQFRNRAIFTQMTGLDAGRVCSLEGGPITFGRDATCTHSFDEASLSRTHAKMTKMEGAYVLEDAGSRNGIFVNEKRVERAVLRDGDRVRLGSAVSLTFRIVDVQEEQTLVRVFESSVKDGLTGVWNRKYLDERLVAELAFATRHKGALGIVLADIDHFKKINDTHGHLVGDEVLKATATTLHKAIRTEDILARYGGEEFVVVARGGDLKSATQLAERLRDITARTPVVVGSQAIARTISAGVATLECCGADATVARLLKVADTRLYNAKERGRNRVVAA